MTLRPILIATLAAALAACGGGSVLDNAPTIANPAGTSSSRLSFAYFQRCIDPIFLAQLSGPGGSTNTCASGGCHDTVTGTGGALRVIPGATAVDLSDPANTPDVVRLSDMYKNFYSSQGVTVIGTPAQSRLFQKPLLLNVLHGGGQIFASAQDPNAGLIAYWISHPLPDEFSSAADTLFDATTGACKTQ
jgi:hypothetical protein